MVCGNNRSDKILKFLKSYITNHEVPRKIHVDQGTSFMSNEIKAFCNGEGIEIIKSPVNDLRATGCVERTIGSLKNSILTFVQEKHSELLKKLIERALGALRFSKNATLNISPFEAHHGREANTVLRNLTKKPSLQNLDWSRVIKTKNACLNDADPNANELPHPADTNWAARSDIAYDINHRSHARRQTHEQSANHDVEPSILISAGHSGQPGPSGLLFQRTGNRNLKRYRQLHSKVKAESAHTLTLNNGVVLRKSGVATKAKPKKSKAGSKSISPSPTPREVKERATKRIAPEKQRKKSGRQFENSGCESEDSDNLPIISVKRTKQPSAEASTEIAQADPTAMTQTDADIGSDQESIPARSDDLDRNPRAPSTSNPGDQPMPAPGKKKGTSKKDRLVSYSSQEDSQDDTGSIASRRSGRKRTALTKMGGVMIDFINQNEKEGKK